jgi:transcriptional regulator with XRE-family HTH domain
MSYVRLSRAYPQRRMVLQNGRKTKTVAKKSQIGTSEVAAIGSRLRRLRKERGLTQAELARQIGIQQSDLSRMEKGEYRVSLDNLFKILGVFDLDLADFFEERKPTTDTGRPLSRQDMKILHLMRELSPEGRAEVQEFLEFKLRKERQQRRSLGDRRSGENGS